MKILLCTLFTLAISGPLLANNWFSERNYDSYTASHESRRLVSIQSSLYNNTDTLISTKSNQWISYSDSINKYTNFSAGLLLPDFRTNRKIDALEDSFAKGVTIGLNGNYHAWKAIELTASVDLGFSYGTVNYSSYEYGYYYENGYYDEINYQENFDSYFLILGAGTSIGITNSLSVVTKITGMATTYNFSRRDSSTVYQWGGQVGFNFRI